MQWRLSLGEVMKRKLFNYAGLQGGWFACALGAASGSPWLGPLVVLLYLALYIPTSEKPREELKFVLIVVAVGLVVDGAKKGSGLIDYASPVPNLDWLAPLWILGMWALFATAIKGALSWLQTRLALAALAGMVFGPLSYLGGVGLGAISFNYPRTPTILILASVWGLAVPMLAWLARRLDH